MTGYGKRLMEVLEPAVRDAHRCRWPVCGCPDIRPEVVGCTISGAVLRYSTETDDSGETTADTPSFLILMDLYRKHRAAAISDNARERLRLLNLIEEFEKTYPEAKAEADRRYPI